PLEPRLAKARSVFRDGLDVVLRQLRGDWPHHRVGTRAGGIGLEPAGGEVGILPGEAGILRRDSVAGRAMAAGARRHALRLDAAAPDLLPAFGERLVVREHVGRL